MSETITLAHGSGGKASLALISDLFAPVFNNSHLKAMEDSAVFALGEERLAFSTDSYVVDPIFFPGGNIGSLAVHGTVNDLAMRGARPICLSVGFILEEGFSIDSLRTIVQTMHDSAAEAGVEIIAGDTKVVPAGKADGIFINTSGIGLVARDVDISGHNGKPGDVIILSGSMADHGATILCQREGLRISGDLASDSAPLSGMVAEMLAAAPGAVHVLRDPTRGGVGTTLNELAMASRIGLRIREKDLPVKPGIRGACDLLGLDPLYLANEGKLLALVAPEKAELLLSVMRKNRFGGEAVVIGEAVADNPGRVIMTTAIGGSRVVDMLHGEALPRIC